MCPYARFQSALIDKDSLVIAYDAGRGDPRGSRSKKANAAAQGLGDCIDCTLCVQVCPTGIDIRKGLQNECIGCAACIDVCDQVMDKVGAPHGLIRYATAQGVEKRWTRMQMLRRALRPRVLVYFAVLAVLCSGFVWSIASRAPFQVDVLKDRAALARVVDEGAIENLYRVQIANRSERPQRLRIRAEGLPGLASEAQREVDLAPAGIASLPVQLLLPAAQAATAGRGSHPIRFVVETTADGGDAAARVVAPASFYVPD